MSEVSESIDTAVLKYETLEQPILTLVPRPKEKHKKKKAKKKRAKKQSKKKKDAKKEKLKEEDKEEAKIMDPVKWYLREAARYPLLKEEEQYALAVKCRTGDLEAKRDFINSNLRLVVPAARAFKNLGVDLIDLIGFGNVGLIYAVERFTPGEAKFSTYANWWIKQQIRRGIIDSQKIKIKHHMHEKLAKFKKLRHSCLSSYNREPDLEEVCKSLKLNPDQAGAVLEAFNTYCSDNTRNDRYYVAPGDLPAGLAQSKNYAEHNDLIAKVNEAYGVLSGRERFVLGMRHDFFGGADSTFRMIGKRIGMTRARAKQIADLAYFKIRRYVENGQTFESDGRALQCRKMLEGRKY